MAHQCHAIGCKVPVPANMFMCLKHWQRVPRTLKRLIWRHYRPGQENDKRPSKEYCEIAIAAVTAIAEKEGRTVTGKEDELMLYRVFAPDDEEA